MGGYNAEQARARIDRLARVKAGDELALAELEAARRGLDPILLADQSDPEDLAASRSSAAKKAWETRRAAGWVHPRSRGA